MDSFLFMTRGDGSWLCDGPQFQFSWRNELIRESFVQKTGNALTHALPQFISFRGFNLADSPPHLRIYRARFHDTPSATLHFFLAAPALGFANSPALALLRNSAMFSRLK